MKQSNMKNAAISGFSNSVIIPRTELIKNMKEKSMKKNIFITAPGGYGKTVTVTQFLSSVRGRTARLTIDYADNDQGFFYRRLASALLKLVGKEKPTTISQLTLDGLLETMSRLPEKNARCYLALDDVHVLKNDEILNSLTLLVNRLPRYICLCFVSRAEPPTFLMKTGRIEVFTKDDLLFKTEEIEWLGEEMEHSLTREQVLSLRETTGGWAMYISAILSCASTETIGNDKTPETLLQYLDFRVWGLWDRETKSLLLRLALPNEITPQLVERLTGLSDGNETLMWLTKKENAFLSHMGGDTYRFHDIFRDFLLERAVGFLGEKEICRLNGIAAGWYYEQGDYYAAARHYIQNKDHDGINRCIKATNRYHDRAGNMSVEVNMNFIKQHIWKLTPEFLECNPYLISECVFEAFLDGNTERFFRYADRLYQRLPEISEKHPDLFESAGFLGALDFRVPLETYAKKVAEMLPYMRVAVAPDAEASSSTITQNLPFFHRSMRDFSQYHELKESDLKLLRETFGVMIGNDYAVMEQSLIAGIYYERGELLNAVSTAISGCRACGDGMQPETFFSAHMILATTLLAMGANRQVNRIMKQIEAYIEEIAPFLRVNFKAFQTKRAIRSGDIDSAKEWLEVYASHAEHLPFYQMSRHFATLRSYIAVKDYNMAIQFGNRLQILAVEYKRPLDKIESGLLTAIALWKAGEKKKAIRLTEQVVDTAMLYGFIQLFINDGKDILPILWELREKIKNSEDFTQFVDRITNEIYVEHEIEPAKEHPPRFTEKQLATLTYLCTGMSYNEIAEALGIGHGTAKSYVLLIYKRLGVHNAQDAAVKAKMLGLLDQNKKEVCRNATRGELYSLDFE